MEEEESDSSCVKGPSNARRKRQMKQDSSVMSDSASESAQDEAELRVRPKTAREILYERFFTIITEIKTTEFQKKRCVVECRICKARLQVSMQVSNTTRHLRLRHKEAFQEFEELKAEAVTPQTEECNQEYFQKLTARVIIENLLPVSILENSAFKDFATYLNPKFKLMSPQSALNTIEHMYAGLVDDIKSQISSKYVCTTADVWSTKNTTVFAYTIHWLDKSLERRSAALACVRFCGKDAYSRINDVVIDINARYALNSNNVRATITDNGFSFLKSFQEMGLETIPDCCQLAEDHMAEVLAPGFCTTPLTTIFPKAMMCATHSLQLLATKDLMDIVNMDAFHYPTMHQKVMEECTNLWNRSNLPENSAKAHEILGSELSYPVITRWNSFYDALKYLVDNKEKIDELCEACDTKKFDETDFEYLEEFLALLKPIADALEFLQQKTSIVYGYLLPTLATIRTKYHKMRDKYFNYMPYRTINMLENALRDRFRNYFLLKPEINDAIVASVLCPGVKLKWIAALDPCLSASKLTEIRDLVRRLIVDDLPLDWSKSKNKSNQEEHRVKYFDFNLTTTQMPQAVGAAYAYKRRPNNDACVVCYFGEGAASEGDAHAAFNFAATLKCPVILFCRNNGFAISTPSHEQYNGDGIAVRGPAYGMATIRVDGTDVFAVYNAMKIAREYVLQENKPVVFEAMSYRVGHHSTSDDSTAYRSAEEIEIWNTLEHPITKLKNFMLNKGWFNEQEENDFVKDVRKQVLKQITISEKKLKPSWKEMFEGVYAELPTHLKDQMNELEQHVAAHKEFYPIKNFKA